MSNGSELKREEDMDPSLHRPSLSLTPPEHQNDVIMNRLHQRSMGRTLSGPSEHTSTTATSTILTPTGSTVTMRRTTSLCEPMSHHDARYNDNLWYIRGQAAKSVLDALLYNTKFDCTNWFFFNMF
jgi:hypothetical protein